MGSFTGFVPVVRSNGDAHFYKWAEGAMGEWQAATTSSRCDELAYEIPPANEDETPDCSEHSIVNKWLTFFQDAMRLNVGMFFVVCSYRKFAPPKRRQNFTAEFSVWFRTMCFTSLKDSCAFLLFVGRNNFVDVTILTDASHKGRGVGTYSYIYIYIYMYACICLKSRRSDRSARKLRAVKLFIDLIVFVIVSTTGSDSLQFFKTWSYIMHI